MMTPEQAIDVLMVTPYVAGGEGLHGADCWGVVELWHKHVLDIKLPDRAEHSAGHGGLQAGFDSDHDWMGLKEPVDNCIVIMRSHGFDAGHVGVYYDGHVLHSDEHHGCIYQSFRDKRIRNRVTKLLIHKDVVT